MSHTTAWMTALVLGAASALNATESKRMNVLFIISDDLNNFLGCYGDSLAKTPHLDRLAQRGVLFQRAYCSFPLCGPSRNSMLTGLYPNSSGILSNAQIFRQTIPSHRSLPHAFRDAGYFAARIGKLYHYNVPGSVGTDGHDDPASWELELNPAGVDRLLEEPDIFTLTPGQFGGTLSWYASPREDKHHTDAMLAADAEWVLERCARQKDRPFFLAVGFFRPHTPYVAPRPYFDLYPREAMPLHPPVEAFRVPELPDAALGSYKKEQDKLTDDLRRECVQAYYASISFMDAQVGRILDALDRLKLADRTIIVFTSDHGYHMGEHGLWQKMSLFEESSRVPLMIAVPNRSRGGTVAEAPVSHVDLYPTLAELCGVPTPDNLQGQSLVPMLSDPSVKGRGWALSHVTRGGIRRASPSSPAGVTGNRFFGYSIRTPRWRYTEWDDGNQGRELYDHDADPKEMKNLAAETAHAATIAELSALLRNAVKSSFPPDGVTPPLMDGLWAPDITHPTDRGLQAAK